MTFPLTGNPITLLDFKSEMGGTEPLSLGDYYNIIPGTSTGLNNGPISMGEFLGKTFFVVEKITADKVWTPINLNVSKIHIFVVGGGGSGGCAWPDRNEGTYNNTDGVAASGGGGGGGVSYSYIFPWQATPSTIKIGSGGAGVTVTGEGGSKAGNSGTNSTFVGSGLSMVGGGGSGGAARMSSDGGTSSASVSAAQGGTATGANYYNFAGGDGGAASISASGVGKVASGGGGIAFSTAHNSLKNASAASGNGDTSPGVKVSGYSSFPAILASYIIGRDQSPVLSSTVTSYNGSDGVVSDSSASASVSYGSGSGGCSNESTPRSGRGGNGIVIIVYEI